MDIERERLFARLDEEKIWYVPLKGCVLQDFYPTYGMRQMSDNDILFDASRDLEVKSIMESIGFVNIHFGLMNHDVYHKDPECNFELHRCLFDESYEPRLYEYYKDVDQLLVSDCDGTEARHFRDEDFYIYLISHEYKHFSTAGTGIRSLLDTFVFCEIRARH